LEQWFALDAVSRTHLGEQYSRALLGQACVFHQEAVLAVNRQEVLRFHEAKHLLKLSLQAEQKFSTTGLSQGQQLQQLHQYDVRSNAALSTNTFIAACIGCCIDQYSCLRATIRSCMHLCTMPHLVCVSADVQVVCASRHHTRALQRQAVEHLRHLGLVAGDDLPAAATALMAAAAAAAALAQQQQQQQR
jgi:hypothetical protein